MIKRSRGRRQKYVSALIPFCASDKWKIFQEQQKDEKAKLKSSRCIRLAKMQWVSMEKGLNSSEQISQDFRHCLFFARSRRIWRPRTSSQKTSRTGSSSCQCSMTLCGKRTIRIVSLTLKRSRITRRDSNQYIGHFWVQGRKRDGMAILMIKKDNGIAQPTKWCSDSKKLAILSSRVPALWVVESFTSMEILRMRDSCSKKFMLSICSVSTEQLRIGVISSHWQKKKKDESGLLWTIKFWPWWNHKKWNCRYLFRISHAPRKSFELPNTGREDTAYTTKWKSFLPTSCDCQE